MKPSTAKYSTPNNRVGNCPLYRSTIGVPSALARPHPADFQAGVAIRRCPVGITALNTAATSMFATNASTPTYSV